MNCVYEKNQDETSPLPLTSALLFGKDLVAWRPAFGGTPRSW
jgi:hypothetical protein